MLGNSLGAVEGRLLWLTIVDSLGAIEFCCVNEKLDEEEVVLGPMAFEENISGLVFFFYLK